MHLVLWPHTPSIFLIKEEDNGVRELRNSISKGTQVPSQREVVIQRPAVPEELSSDVEELHPRVQRVLRRVNFIFGELP